MELELKAAHAKNRELERMLAEERLERLAFLDRLKENADIIANQHQEIEELKESQEIFSMDVSRLETENDHLIRKLREETAMTVRIQQELDDSLERYFLMYCGPGF
jgi:cupin superfamily acireductone dioxygenase involved in methionine salvage